MHHSSKSRVSLTALVLCFSIFILLQSCALNRQEDPAGYVVEMELLAPTQWAFSHCHSTGCLRKEVVHLDEGQWQDILNEFGGRAKSAEQERRQIRIAIGKFEQVVGKVAGTDTDVGGTFVDLFNQRQDCVDESTNTTIYLILLDQQGLLVHHDVLRPSYRFLRSGLPGWPHQTATIREKNSGDQYAVDSWFLDNGNAPFIVPLHDWTMGWQPSAVAEDSM